MAGSSQVCAEANNRYRATRRISALSKKGAIGEIRDDSGRQRIDLARAWREAMEPKETCWMTMKMVIFDIAEDYAV